MTSRNLLSLRPYLLGSSALWLIACGQGASPTNEAQPGQTEFVSIAPQNDNRSLVDSDGGLNAAGDALSGAPEMSAPPKSDDGADAERAISEADILKVDGNRLYALSRYSGLSVIDISRPAALRLLGTHRTSAMPFEMYVEGERAYVMYNGWGHYEVGQDGAWSWQTTSRIQALDLSDPAHIQLLGEKDMPGELSDSRKVGDILYLVTFENGYCWQCEQTANTRVVSFDVQDPDDFRAIDELRLSETGGYWGKRSISVTEERIYISGWDWSGSEAGVIDVVDISDAGGNLVAGAEVAIAGPIESRWQIDEFEGVLRVISQPGGWNTSTPPVVETFRVSSSDDISALGSLEMQLPRPEDLRSVRFDGERAYAITFERTDPLFTLDLSDPAAPLQAGELEIPGWVYHMEPRGDRIYALGFDDASDAGGALHVSLFDVSDLSRPEQLARVNFGGTWASFAEDQDRIHKAFNIMPDQGLILVPFSGWDYDDSANIECSSGDYLSGIQLVDMTTDSLSLRGVAPQVGQARRGFLANDALFGLSDNAVQTFDISDRDAPAALGELELARNVNTIKVMGDAMLRFGQDWWTEKTTLDFAALDRVDQAEPLGDIDLSDYAITDQGCYSYSYWEGQVLVSGDYAYVPRRSYSWSDKVSDPSGRANTQTLTFYIVNLKDKAEPKVVGRFSVETESDEESFTGSIQTESAILVGRQTSVYGTDPATGEGTYESRLTYDVISLAEPENLQVVSQLEMPESLTNGGFGYNYSGCSIDVGWGWWWGYGGSGTRQALVSGDLVASQHQVPVGDDGSQVRYYLDLIDVSNPAAPQLLAPVNIPGSVIDFDGETGRIVTIDYLVVEQAARTWEECKAGSFFEDEQLCREYRRQVHTLELDGDVARLIDTAAIDSDKLSASSIAVSKTRLFAHYYEGTGQGLLKTFALRGSGALEALADQQPEISTWGNLVARGDRAFLSSYGRLTVLDTTDKQALTLKDHELGGYSCDSLEVSDGFAYCALGYQGVQAFPLD